jgi:hypothetical protein
MRANTNITLYTCFVNTKKKHSYPELQTRRSSYYFFIIIIFLWKIISDSGQPDYSENGKLLSSLR